MSKSTQDQTFQELFSKAKTSERFLAFFGDAGFGTTNLNHLDAVLSFGGVLFHLLNAEIDSERF